MADEDENKSPPSVSTSTSAVASNGGSNGGSFATTTESFPAEFDFANFDDEPEAGSPFADYNKPSDQDEDFFATFPAAPVEDEDPLRSLPGDVGRRDLFATWDDDEDNHGESNAVGDSRSRDASPATSRRWLEQDVEDFFGDSVSAGTSNENKGAGMRSASNNERHLFDLEHGDGGRDDGLGIGANNNIDENVDDELFPSTLVRPIGLRVRGNGASRMPDRYSGAEHRGAEDLFDDLFDDGAGNNELMTNFASFGSSAFGAPARGQVEHVGANSSGFNEDVDTDQFHLRSRECMRFGGFQVSASSTSSLIDASEDRNVFTRRRRKSRAGIAAATAEILADSTSSRFFQSSLDVDLLDVDIISDSVTVSYNTSGGPGGGDHGEAEEGEDGESGNGTGATTSSVIPVKKKKPPPTAIETASANKDKTSVKIEEDMNSPDTVDKIFGIDEFEVVTSPSATAAVNSLGDASKSPPFSPSSRLKKSDEDGMPLEHDDRSSPASPPGTDEHEEQKGPAGAPSGTSTKAIDASKPPTVAPPQLGSSASSPKSITKTEGGGTKNRDLSKSFEAELDDGDDGTSKEEDDTPEDDTTVFTVDPLDYFSPSELLDKLSSYDERNYVFRQIQFAVLVPGKLQFGFAMGGRGVAGGIMRRDFIVDAHTWSLSSSVATPLHFRDREMVLRPVETNDVLMLMYGSSPQENTHEIVLLLNGQVAGWWALQVSRSDVEELYGFITLRSPSTSVKALSPCSMTKMLEEDEDDSQSSASTAKDDFEEDDYGAGLVAPGSGEQSRDHLADMNLTGEDATSELLKLTKLQKLNVRKVEYPLTRLGKVCYGDRTGIIGPDGHSLMEVGTGIFYEGVVDFVRNPKTL